MRAANHTPASSPPAALAWAPYAACAWAWLFALASFYWAAGGRWGLDTLGNGIQAQVHDPAFIAVVWLTGFVKVIAGYGALTLVRPWLLWMPRAIKLVAAWSGGAGLALYGSIQIIVGALVRRHAHHRRDGARMAASKSSLEHWYSATCSAQPVRWIGAACAGMCCCGTRGGRWEVYSFCSPPGIFSGRPRPLFRIGRHIYDGLTHPPIPHYDCGQTTVSSAKGAS